MTILSSSIIGNRMKVKIKIKLDKRSRQSLEGMSNNYSPFIVSESTKQKGIDVSDFNTSCALNEHDKKIFDELVNSMFGGSVHPTMCKQLDDMFDKKKKYGSIQFPNRTTFKPEEHIWPEVGNPVKEDSSTPKQGLMSGFDSPFSDDVMINLCATIIADTIKDESIGLNKEQFDKLVDAVDSKFKSGLYPSGKQ